MIDDNYFSAIYKRLSGKNHRIKTNQLVKPVIDKMTSDNVDANDRTAEEENSMTCGEFIKSYEYFNPLFKHDSKCCNDVSITIQDFLYIRSLAISRYRPPILLKVSGLTPNSAEMIGKSIHLNGVVDQLQ
jgi:hypothetical protein